MRPVTPGGRLALVLLGLVLATAGAPAQDARARALGAVQTVTEPCVRDVERFSYRVRAGEALDAELVRRGDDSFVVRLRSEHATVSLLRDAERTLLHVPEHGVVFVGEGALAAGDESLAPDGFAARLLGAKSGLLGVGRAMLLAKLRQGEDRDARFAIEEGVTLAVPPDAAGKIVLSSSARRGFFDDVRDIEIAFDPDPDVAASLAAPDAKVIAVGRAELERMVFRALRRALEIYVPGLDPRDPARPRRVDHGELRFVEGQRLLLLHGTPAQIGRAHGLLLGDVALRTLDSCLYLVGMIETVRGGKWFPGVLEDAWRRLSPHIPDAHRRELDALADAVPGLSRRELRLANVFPEYFHCSGFAVFGKATVDGTLYHGRVLDYMTMIGLQHAATTIVTRPARGHGFLNVGYAGFIGAVTGINERQLSLGEMGGGGRFQWDGVPMAMLMRRALEECSTLSEVEALWRRSPRTCEYYYVFADGKNHSAVAVAATPDRIEFGRPGQDHPRLGKGIEDTVVLSSGKRLALLRERIITQHGAIDAEAARRLMDRPVAMRSNLHNALMVPEAGEVWIAHAGRDRPAAAMPYVKFELHPLLAELEAEAGGERVVPARDTLEPGKVAPEVREMVAEFGYECGDFDVIVRPRVETDATDAEAIVSFASPRPRGDARGDRVVLEWYRAPARSAPAMLVMHILDGRMRVARSIARWLSRHGVHAFVMHMPGYGQRGTRRERRDVTTFSPRTRQGVADARRARDAIAALPGVDPRAISIQGTSLGGFVAALSSALDGAFTRTFLMLAGGDLPSMFRNGGKDTAKIRRRLHGAGWDDARIDAAVTAIDPARLGHRLDPRRTWLYSARDDQVVPAACARALGRAARLDDEHHLWFAGNHYSCAIHLPQIMEHMAARLSVVGIKSDVRGADGMGRPDDPRPRIPGRGDRRPLVFRAR